jgi:hypothetical protein
MADTTLNTKPIFSSVPVVGFSGLLKTANTNMDGTGTVLTAFTADAANGGRIEKLKVRALGTNIATVLRVFINNGSDPTTATNNALYSEMTLAATTASATTALADSELALNLALPAGYKINVTVGTTVAAGFHVIGVGGKY